MENRQRELTGQKLWLVSLGSMLAVQNGYYVKELLLDEPDDEARINEGRVSLKRDWGIHDRETLKDSLAFLDNGGHSRGYMDMARQWGHIHEEQCEKALASIDDETYKSKVRLVNTHHMALHNCGIYAWDAGRAAHLIRDAWYLGIITEEEEIWELLLQWGKKVQPQFTGWDHFGLSYAVGRAYWAVQNLSKPFCNNMYTTLRKITLDTNHPWNQLEWNLLLQDP
ncbi:DUF1266 domain-containing protein [Fulvivirga kasyanovii]|uniref:DUF1266 domain-containing protein n=1 Tax=Fulvivirga kasyanovii TaxID=396812 RepID=A0ABW9RQS2_9BACT|nr:DUF1266 domain-containing protein [Fulvivirga kasyanovii]MTI26513.1 DUF1266 domain-containing protein [Fulvivirga kasyanovii]